MGYGNPVLVKSQEFVKALQYGLPPCFEWDPLFLLPYFVCGYSLNPRHKRFFSFYLILQLLRPPSGVFISCPDLKCFFPHHFVMFPSLSIPVMLVSFGWSRAICDVVLLTVACRLFQFVRLLIRVVANELHLVVTPQGAAGWGLGRKPTDATHPPFSFLGTPFFYSLLSSSLISSPTAGS